MIRSLVINYGKVISSPLTKDGSWHLFYCPTKKGANKYCIAHGSHNATNYHWFNKAELSRWHKRIGIILEPR